MPRDIFTPGNVGVVSRSGTLTYQIVNELTQRGIGQSTAVGIGGDPIIGTDFIEILSKFEADPETHCAVMIGEIGGNAEQLAAEYVQSEMQTPVVAYIAGFTAPEGKTMGHAGAIVSGGESTAEAKSEALRAAGIRAATNPSEVAELVAEALGESPSRQGASDVQGWQPSSRRHRRRKGLVERSGRRADRPCFVRLSILALALVCCSCPGVLDADPVVTATGLRAQGNRWTSQG